MIFCLNSYDCFSFVVCFEIGKCEALVLSPSRSGLGIVMPVCSPSGGRGFVSLRLSWATERVPVQHRWMVLNQKTKQNCFFFFGGGYLRLHLRTFFYFCEKIPLNFWWGLHWTYRCLYMPSLAIFSEVHEYGVFMYTGLVSLCSVNSGILRWVWLHMSVIPALGRVSRRVAT